MWGSELLNVNGGVDRDHVGKVKPGTMLLLTLIGAAVGWALSGPVSDGSTQSHWEACCTFWVSSGFAACAAVGVLRLSRFKIRIHTMLEFMVVAAVLSSLFVHLRYQKAAMDDVYESLILLEERALQAERHIAR